MKRLLIAVIITALAVSGCSLNDAMTKAYDKAHAAVIQFNRVYLDIINKIQETVGMETINYALSQYNDDEAADFVIAKYEEISGEKFSERNKYLLKETLVFLFAKWRKDLQTPQGGGDGTVSTL